MLVPRYQRSSSLRFENIGLFCFLCYIWKWKTFPGICSENFRTKVVQYFVCHETGPLTYKNPYVEG